MEQNSFTNIPELTKFDTFSKKELIECYKVLEDELRRVVKENYQLRNQKISDDQLAFVIHEQLGELRQAMFGSSSEKYKKSEKPKEKVPPKPRVQKPSERYPNLPVVEEVISMDKVPDCQCCGKPLCDSGMTEDSEQLTVIPKKYEIRLIKRKKYRCEKCHGDIQTTPAPARIKEGSSYSDEMITDVALSKYCDLIPIERYAAMAKRGSWIEIPPHALIELTHYLAEYLQGMYHKIRDRALLSLILYGDETPHRMLEGSDKKSWYLWGFSTPTECFFECHSTRSGDVAHSILEKSQCEILVSDVYAGYAKAITAANKVRGQNNKPLIMSANCNAHARRYFFQSHLNYRVEAEYFLDRFVEIYKLNDESKGKSSQQILELRAKMEFYFKEMKAHALDLVAKFPLKNQLAKALNYFLNNYVGLTLFLKHADVPIDNNQQERLLRSPVVGRKTWYGTHSERGAETGAILFTIVETCKLNNVNPREYVAKLIQDLHQGKPGLTPIEYKLLSPI